MVSIRRVEKGIATYLDKEMMPKMDTEGLQGFGIGVATSLLIKRVGNIIEGYKNNGVAQALLLTHLHKQLGDGRGTVDLIGDRHGVISRILERDIGAEAEVQLALGDCHILGHMFDLPCSANNRGGGTSCQYRRTKALEAAAKRVSNARHVLGTDIEKDDLATIQPFTAAISQLLTGIQLEQAEEE